MDSRSSRPDPRAVLGAFRTHRTSVCQGCGLALRQFETRHSVDGAVFHTQCVPGARDADGPRRDRPAI